MSTVPVTTKPQKTRRDRDKERDKERKSSLPQPNERLKTVVRRLPPNLPEDVFWQSVQSWVTEETAVWKIFYQGKLRKKLNKENIPSRAYIAFKTEEQLALFSREYDGHVFRDKTGVESQAVVEFAPYPKIPSEKKKLDSRNATIEKDEDYISFLESLRASENAEPVTLESLMASSQPPPPPKTTPLLEALKAEKSANKDKEAILRNHAHYNQTNSGSSRKEEKKKASQLSVPLPPKASESSVSNATTTSKQAQKKAQGQGNAPAASALQNTKNSQHAASAPKNVPNAAATANQTPKIAKPPRPPRGGAVKAEAPASVPPTPTDSATTPDAPAPRRSRPVIGLGSRQFEAALSGVSGLVGAVSERKRREKEKAAASGDGSTPEPAPTISYARIDGPETDKPAPTSPKKDKTRRGTRGGGGGGGAVSATASSAPSANGAKVPSILQRSSDTAPPVVVVQRNASASSNVNADGAALPVAAVPTTGARGGGRRGRGGGRGRGGDRGGVAPGAPRGGG